jgi:hypothetical protein
MKWLDGLLDGREPKQKVDYYPPGIGSRLNRLEKEVQEDLAMRGLGAYEICPIHRQRCFLGERCSACVGVESAPVPASRDPLKLLRAFCDLAMALPQPPRWDADWYRWRALRGLAHWGRAVLAEGDEKLAA